MGIADDIRPKKSFESHHRIDDYFSAPKHEPSPTHHKPNPESKASQELDKPVLKNDQIEPFRHPTSASLMQDDFFKPAEYEPLKQSSKDQKSTERHLGRKILVVIMFLVIIGLAAYQSYKKSLSLYDSNKINETKNEEYKGEVITQDSPATDQSVPITTTPTTETPAQSTAPITAPIIDKSKVVLKVLNGNGITGSAATVKNQLVAAGFSVAAVTNAKSFSYQTTIVYYHTGKEAEAGLVKDSITDKQVSLELSDTVTGKNDVVVVVGKK